MYIDEAKLVLKSSTEVPRTELLDLIDSLQRFAISRDTDLSLSGIPLISGNHIIKSWVLIVGVVLDGAVLATLYREGGGCVQKAAGKVATQPSTHQGKKSRVQFASPVTVARTEDSFMSIEDWDTADVESDCSMESCIIVATPRPWQMQVLRPSTPPSPLQRGSHRSASTSRTSMLPVTASTRVLRSRLGAKYMERLVRHFPVMSRFPVMYGANLLP